MEAVSFGYRIGWLAIRTDAPQRVVQALGLRNVAATSPALGVAAAYEWDGSHYGTRVFVSPPIHGWVLCAGTAFFAFADAQNPSFGELALRLSRELRCDVQFFCTHRVVEAHAWARADAGQLRRAYLYVGESGETAVDYGAPTDDELHLGFALFHSSGADTVSGGQVSCPTEEDVIRLAGRWSLDPTNLPEMSDGLLGDLPRRDSVSEAPAAGPHAAAPVRKRRWKFW